MLRTVLRDRSRRPVPEEADFDEEEHFVATVERELYVVNKIIFISFCTHSKMSSLTWRSSRAAVRSPRQATREFPGLDLREVLRGSSQEYNIPDTRGVIFLFIFITLFVLCFNIG